ncbi:hypothetical protein BZA70DRAFT_111124 [Myxozyma melibiosi]|uniref:Pinin/SDK/MemA protein domain-containing protein n=1 Tax=Myxozyma melibiosi TaxID=54550 RepID=A0ABR1FA16_9ASCO
MTDLAAEIKDGASGDSTSGASSSKRSISDTGNGKNESNLEAKTGQSSSQPSTQSTGDAPAPKRVRREHDPLKAKLEEKGRSRRMFGQILSSLGQFKEETTRSAATSKRSLVDKQVQQALAEKDKKLQEETTKRNKQIQFENEKSALKAQIERLRKDAKFLRTKAKPSILYKPYIFTDDEEDTLDRQFDEAEDEVDRLWDQFRRKYPDAERSPVHSESESERSPARRSPSPRPHSPALSQGSPRSPKGDKMDIEEAKEKGNGNGVDNEANNKTDTAESKPEADGEPANANKQTASRDKDEKDKPKDIVTDDKADAKDVAKEVANDEPEKDSEK